MTSFYDHPDKNPQEESQQYLYSTKRQIPTGRSIDPSQTQTSQKTQKTVSRKRAPYKEDQTPKKIETASVFHNVPTK